MWIFRASNVVSKVTTVQKVGLAPAPFEQGGQVCGGPGHRVRQEVVQAVEGRHTHQLVHEPHPALGEEEELPPNLPPHLQQSSDQRSAMQLSAVQCSALVPTSFLLGCSDHPPGLRH